MLERPNITEATFDLFRADTSNPQAILDTLCRFHDTIYDENHVPSARRFASSFRITLSTLPMADNEATDAADKLCDAIYKIAEYLDEHPLEHPYHNVRHILTVTAARIMLGTMEHAATGRGAWTADEVYKLARGVLIAINHDTDHLGRKNAFPMEQEAIAHARLEPILQSLGIHPKEQEFIRCATLLTDPNIPGEIVKTNGHHHGLTDSNLLHLPDEKLIALIDSAGNKEGEEHKKAHKILLDLYKTTRVDKEKAREALFIRTADMIASYGIDIDYHYSESAKVLKELNIAKQLIQVSPAMHDATVINKFVGAKRRLQGWGLDLDYFLLGDIEACFPLPLANVPFGKVLSEIETANRNGLGVIEKIKLRLSLRDYSPSLPALTKQSIASLFQPHV